MKKKKFSFQKRNKKKVLKNETIYSYALACFTKFCRDDIVFVFAKINFLIHVMRNAPNKTYNCLFNRGKIKIKDYYIIC
jgi:hypothetical protein